MKRNIIRKIIIRILRKCPLSIFDQTYIKLLYKDRFGKKLNLKNPQTFNEKIQWLKFYDRNPNYIKMVDKYEVKEYIANKIGKEYIIPLIGVYDKFEDINFSELPNQFVIKCTHDYGSVIICKEKSEFDEKTARKKIERSMKKNLYYSAREWQYKSIKPRIIIETYMEQENNNELNDYKFYCFNGQPKFTYISEGLSNQKTGKISFADINYKKLKYRRSDYLEFDELPPKPVNYEKMIELSKILSENMPFVRVDFYEINGQIYFGELTITPSAGFTPFLDSKHDQEIGEFLVLPSKERM